MLQSSGTIQHVRSTHAAVVTNGVGKKGGEGASVWKKSGGLELLFSAGLEQNTFSFCQQSHSGTPVMQIHFAFAEAVGSDSAEEQQLRGRQRPEEVNQGPAGPQNRPFLPQVGI